MQKNQPEPITSITDNRVLLLLSIIEKLPAEQKAVMCKAIDSLIKVENITS